MRIQRIVAGGLQCAGDRRREVGSQAEVRVGRPHAEIARVAADVGADLVLVGPHGDRPRPWKPLGTTAERLLHALPVAVLVARNVHPSPPRQILVAVEEADITTAVLRWAVLHGATCPVLVVTESRDAIVQPA